jgi:hypothetical protein
MIKIGNEKLFSMTELLENFNIHLRCRGKTNWSIDNNECFHEINSMADIIGESADFVRGFVTSRREG